jgi:hypothetical protein
MEYMIAIGRGARSRSVATINSLVPTTVRPVAAILYCLIGSVKLNGLDLRYTFVASSPRSPNIR